MGVRFPSVQGRVPGGTNIGVNVETVVATTPPLTIPLDFATVLLFWFIGHTVGATAASCSYFIRRGTTTGGTAVFGPLAQTVVAGNLVVAGGAAFDTPGAVGGQQYVLTCIDTGSTVAGAVGDAFLLAFAL
jgi:hypothetical protein